MSTEIRNCMVTFIFQLKERIGVQLASFLVGMNIASAWIGSVMELKIATMDMMSSIAVSNQLPLYSQWNLCVAIFNIKSRRNLSVENLKIFWQKTFQLQSRNTIEAHLLSLVLEDLFFFIVKEHMNVTKSK